MMNQLKTLCELNGVSGNEDVVRAYIMERVRPYADSIRTDVMGNLIVMKKGAKSAPNHLMLSAHMDEVGLIVSHITDEGYLKFQFVGGVDRRVTIGKPVTIGDGNVAGVIGLKAYHLVSREEEKTIPPASSFYIDIGAKDKAEAESMVGVGDYGSFVCQSEETAQGHIRAKAIDDRLGCAIMMELLKQELPMDVTFAFTVQEEVGLRGAFTAAFAITPKISLVLEATTAADLPSVPNRQKVCKVGGGAVISYMDNGAIYDRGLFELLRDAANERDIAWQTKEYISGGNDSRTIQRTKEGVRVAVISAPVRYLHAPASVASVTDISGCYALAEEFIGRIAQQLEGV